MNKMIQFMMKCNVIDAPSQLKNLKQEYIDLGYEVQDLFLGAFRYELCDGFVIVSFDQIDGYQGIWEQAFPKINN